MSNAFSRVVHDDAAENSIMQTITIAVSAILVAAGLVTAPGLINNARDNNATTDLANSAYAEESLLAVDGRYWVYDNFNVSQYRQMEKPGIEGAVNFLPSAKSRLIVETTDDGKKWVATSYSTSGKVFARSSESAETVQLTGDNFSSFSSILAGEKIVLANASPEGSDLIIPDGITVATVGNMYEASVEEEPYDFTRAATRAPELPGEGIPTAKAQTPTPDPTTPAPAPAPVPSGPTTFNFSDVNDTKTNITMSDNYYGGSTLATQTYFKTGTQTDTTADKSIRQDYGTIKKSTSWTISNASVVFTDSAGKKINAPLSSFRYTEFTVNGSSTVYNQIDLVNPQFDRTAYNPYFYFTNFDLTLDGKHTFNFNIEEF
jgi:hypothetical protein